MKRSSQNAMAITWNRFPVKMCLSFRLRWKLNLNEEFCANAQFVNFFLPLQGEIQLGELYRSLMIIAAHLHVMIHDVHDSSRFCPLENVAHLQMLQQWAFELFLSYYKEKTHFQFRLIGQVKTSMCLMLQSAVRTEREENHVDYFRVTHEVLQSFFHRYYYCSTR